VREGMWQEVRGGAASSGSPLCLSKSAARLVTATVIWRGRSRRKTKRSSTSRWGRVRACPVMNPYGSISVKPSQSNAVIVTAIFALRQS